YVYESAEGVAMRIVADHARATAFAIGDGIAPGNLGRNYVIRKIIRRAIYHGVKELGLQTPFFYRVTQFVTEFMAEPVPDLGAARTAIDRAVRDEEHRFSRILNVGQPKLEEIFERFAPDMPPMTEIVKAYDTYGVPRDLIRVVLGQHGVEMDEDEFSDKFNQALNDLQQQAQPVMSGVKARRTSEVYSRLAERLPRTEFLGYRGTEAKGATVLALISGE